MLLTEKEILRYLELSKEGIGNDPFAQDIFYSHEVYKAIGGLAEIALHLQRQIKGAIKEIKNGSTDKAVAILNNAVKD